MRNPNFLVDLPALARISDLERELPYKKTWIWLAVRQGRFPAPIRLGRGCTVWTRSSVEAWLAARVVAATEGQP